MVDSWAQLGRRGCAWEGVHTPDAERCTLGQPGVQRRGQGGEGRLRPTLPQPCTHEGPLPPCRLCSGRWKPAASEVKRFLLGQPAAGAAASWYSDWHPKATGPGTRDHLPWSLPKERGEKRGMRNVSASSSLVSSPVTTGQLPVRGNARHAGAESPGCGVPRLLPQHTGKCFSLCVTLSRGPAAKNRQKNRQPEGFLRWLTVGPFSRSSQPQTLTG